MSGFSIVFILKGGMMFRRKKWDGIDNGKSNTQF